MKQNEDVGREWQAFLQLCYAQCFCIDVSRQSQVLPLEILCWGRTYCGGVKDLVMIS